MHAAIASGEACRWKVTLDDRIGAVKPYDCEILLLDQALRDLAGAEARQAEIVELRYFGGLSEIEVATLLSISRATVTREWQAARTWLYRQITRTVTNSD